MFAKRSSRALALLLALPSAAFALGLGDIHLLSPLNAPLDAEIELVDVAPDEVNTVQVQLASRDTFAKYGLDWPAYLAGVQLKTQRTADGRQVIKLKSTDAISEPFVTLLIEVNWARGRLVREYTMLLDPPVYAPGHSAVASAPLAAPATATPGAREGSIARATEAPLPQAAPVPPQATAEQPAAAETAPTAAPAHHARAAPAASAEPVASEESGGSHTVQHGETLSAIAAGVAGAKLNSAHARSWMVAIYNANPEAFRKNMNVMRSGAVLRIPEASEAAAVSPGEASAEIHRQYTAWRGAAGQSIPAPAEQSGHLKLVTPSGPAAANATPAAPPAPSAKEAAAVAAATAAAATAAKDAEARRLLELKNEELARMQAQNAAKQAPTAPAPVPAPAPEATPPAAAAPAATEPAPAPAAEQAPPEVQAAPPAPVQKPKPVTPVAVPAGGSFLDTLLSYWWILAILALGLLGLFALRLVRSKRATTELDDSLGRMAAAGADAAEMGSMSASRGFSEPEPVPVPVPVPVRTTRTSPVAVPDSFLVEETGSHERPRLGTTGTMPAMAAPKHVASDETISSETAINLDQGDPLAEADFHMAYGLYDQAADLIRIAISREPTRRDLKLKLLEVFFVWGNKDQFLASARELAQSRADAAPGEWEKILIMGKQLAPEDPLFSGGGAISGASAGGVDLDLEGGQSRVDFDLIGDEPMPTEVSRGVDLDIGSAVGDLDSTAESQSNITDQNAALLDGNFLDGGTTRQMTGRMRQKSGGSTAEMEGPTVEQPTLNPQDNPTIRQKLESAMRQGGTEHTAELAIDDLGLDVGQIDTIDQPGITSAAASTPDAPTLVAGLDDHSRRVMEDAHRRAGAPETGTSTGAWQFDQDELEAALTQSSQMLPDASATSRMRALSGHDLDVDVGDATGRHMTRGGDVDLDVGAATGTHESHGGTLDLDVGTATVPDAAFAATQRLSSDDLALPDLEPVTMSEVGTKLDLARAYMDMGDPDGARNILEEVLSEGSAAQKQEAQRLIESLPG